MSTRKTGRPTKFTDEVKHKLVKALKAGATHELAAMYAGISPATFYDWKAKGEAGDLEFSEFLEAISDSEAAGAIAILQNISKAAKLPSEWRAGAWLLEHRYPEQYGKQRLDINHSGGLTLSWADMIQQSRQMPEANDDDSDA